MFKEITEKLKKSKQQKKERREFREKEEREKEEGKNFLTFTSFANQSEAFEREVCRYAVLGQDIYIDTKKEFNDCEIESSVYRTENDVLVRRTEYRKDNQVKSRQYAYLDKDLKLHLIVEYLYDSEVGSKIFVVDYMVNTKVGEGNSLKKYDLYNLGNLTKEAFEEYKKVANFISGAEAYYDLHTKNQRRTV